MNILDKKYPEISFKTDAEDLKVMIDFLNDLGGRVQPNHTDIKIKASTSLLKEVRDKLIIKEAQKKGTKKLFLVKFKAYHLSALLDSFVVNDLINNDKPFEKNCIGKYSNLFHQKLTGL